MKNKMLFILLLLSSLALFLSGCEEPIVETPNSMTDSRDGETYATITVGGQTWMAENLRYNAVGSWVNPANPSAIYGRLYEWTTLMNGATSSSTSPSGVQGVCPDGWHIPSDPEWKTLEISLGLSAATIDSLGPVRGTHGTGMKSTTGWTLGTGTNTSGFNAFPAGYYHSSAFSVLGEFTGFWSSTEHSSTRAIYRYLYGLDVGVFRDKPSKPFAFSCRCIKN